MGVLYLVSIIALMTVFLLFKKTSNKTNIIFWVFLSFVLIICYNVLECYILTLFNIKCYLATLSIINIILATLGVVVICRKKQIQRYYIKWQDIISIMVILVTVIIISYQRYGLPMNIKYESSDGATHYIAAKQFYKNKELLVNPEIKDKIYDFKSCMPAAYVNTGIMFDIASSFINESDLYKIYILFDIIVLSIGAVLFYLIISVTCKKTFMHIIALIFAILYMLAYPLNSMLFGFAYLSVSLLAIEGIIAIVPMLKKGEMELKYILPIGFLLTFMLFFSYYLFVPIVYTALGIYLLIDIIKNRKEIKIFSASNILKITVALILPTVLGFIYFILPGLLSGQASDASAIATEGYIYRNLYSNFLLLVPAVLYYVIDTIKNKRNNFVNYSILLALLFILVMLVGIIVGKVSTYYYFKVYFMLWIFAMFATFKVIEKLCNNKEAKTFVCTYLLMIIGIHLFSATNMDSRLQNKNMYINVDPSASLITHIYQSNRNYIKNNIGIYTDSQKEILKYCEANVFNKSDSVAVCANNLQQRWIYAIYGIADVKETRDFALIEKKFNITSWLEGNYDYYLYMNNEDNIEINENENSYKILYSNEGGLVLERNN